MTDRSGDLLAQALQSNETLVDLDVSRNLLRESAGNLIILAKGLHRLNLSRQELGRSKQSIELICRGLSENRTLLHLDMSGCGLSEEDTRSIADSLKFNRKCSSAKRENFNHYHVFMKTLTPTLEHRYAFGYSSSW